MSYEIFGCRDREEIAQYRAANSLPNQKEKQAVQTMSLIEGMGFIEAAQFLGLADDVISIQDQTTHSSYKEILVKDLPAEGDTIYVAGGRTISFVGNFIYIQPLEWLASRSAGCTWASPSSLARVEAKNQKPFWFPYT